MSDLHLEIRNEKQRNMFWMRLKTHAGEAQAVVLAGDIGSIRRKQSNVLKEALHQFEELYGHVIYIPGNHEFWHEGLRFGWDNLNRWQAGFNQITILKSGRRFITPNESFGGDTMWYPDCEDELMKRWWCDYDNISDSRTEIDKQHQAFLAQTSFPDVMVTHHFPTAESVASQYRGDSNNVFFCADIGDWLLKKQDEGLKLPKLWIHGHTHEPMDYRSLLGFRVYCNPLGYPSEYANTKFWERLLVDTDETTWQDPLPNLRGT